MIKNVWVKPQIQILTKRRREEPVLLACKIAADPSPAGPVYQNLACYLSTSCSECSGIVAS